MTTIGKSGTTQFKSFVDGLHKQGAITKPQMTVLKDGTVTNADWKIADSLVQKGKITEGRALRSGLFTAVLESEGKATPEDHLFDRVMYKTQGAARSVENFSNWMNKEVTKMLKGL